MDFIDSKGNKMDNELFKKYVTFFSKYILDEDYLNNNGTRKPIGEFISERYFFLLFLNKSNLNI